MDTLRSFLQTVQEVKKSLGVSRGDRATIEKRLHEQGEGQADLSYIYHLGPPPMISYHSMSPHHTDGLCLQEYTGSVWMSKAEWRSPRYVELDERSSRNKSH
jgi:hypothetical protein